MEKIRFGVCNALYEVANEDIENLPQELLESLDCGDTIIKRTGGQKHCYWVSYKEAGVGLCFTYVDASCVETISYDFNAETKQWVFNSKDVTPLGE